MKRALLLACIGTSALAQTTPPEPPMPGALRPQMSAAEATRYQRSDYLGDWQPGPIQRPAAGPDFVVAGDGSGTHRTVQAALDALPARTAGARHTWVQIKPGSYREQLCVRDRAPFTLAGTPGDASAVTLVFGRHAKLPQSKGTANPCVRHGEATVGTAGSASAAIFSDDVQLADLTVHNDVLEGVRQGQGYPEGAGESGGAQGVALMLEGDRILLDGVRLIGHQDTFYVRKPASSDGRVLVRSSVIAGDVDFIFGNARLVIDNSTILSRAGRRSPGERGIVFAPSTAAAQRLGFLVIDSKLRAEPGLAPQSVALGRAWDFGVAKGEWQPGRSPNGQVLVRESVLGPHLYAWAASTSRRPFTAAGEQAARLSEFNNRLEAASDNAR